jgi:hypothetical protein
MLQRAQAVTAHRPTFPFTRRIFCRSEVNFRPELARIIARRLQTEIAVPAKFA